MGQTVTIYHYGSPHVYASHVNTNVKRSPESPPHTHTFYSFRVLTITRYYSTINSRGYYTQTYIFASPHTAIVFFVRSNKCIRWISSLIRSRMISTKSHSMFDFDKITYTPTMTNKETFSPDFCIL